MLTSARSRLFAAAKPVVEQLEERFFLAATLYKGAVTIVGTPENDTITVSLAPNDPTLLVVRETSSSGPSDLDETTYFEMTGLGGALNGIYIDTGTGDHIVTIDESYGRIYLGVAINCGDGNDTVTGGSGNTVIRGREGDDSITAGTGRLYSIDGGDGNDIIVGGSGPGSYIYGGLGDDSIIAIRGNDSIDGGEGADSITGGIGYDYIWGGKGDDSITGGVGNDTIDAGSGLDTIIANRGNSLLMGGAGDDQIYGGIGNDTMMGGFGADLLFGGRGNCALDGGSGDDSLYGGTGLNTFQLNPGDSRSIIKNFRAKYDIIAKIRYMPAWWQNASPIQTALNDVIIGNATPASLQLRAISNKISLLAKKGLKAPVKAVSKTPVKKVTTITTPKTTTAPKTTSIFNLRVR